MSISYALDALLLIIAISSAVVAGYYARPEVRARRGRMLLFGLAIGNTLLALNIIVYNLSGKIRGQPNERRSCSSQVSILHSRIADNQNGYLVVLSSREQTDWEFVRVELDDEIAREQFKMPEYVRCFSGTKFRKLAPIASSQSKPKGR